MDAPEKRFHTLKSLFAETGVDGVDGVDGDDGDGIDNDGVFVDIVSCK